MKTSQSENDYLKALANIKWAKGFKCIRCKCKEAYVVKEFYRRCKTCGYEEPPTKNTMFEGSKMSVQLSFEILLDMQKTLENFIAKKFEETDISGVKLTSSKAKRFDENYTAELIRDSLAYQSNKFGVAENTISLLYKRIDKWMGRRTMQNRIPPLLEWMKGLKDKESKRMYGALYNFLIYESENQIFAIPTIEQMLKMSITREPYFNWGGRNIDLFALIETPTPEEEIYIECMGEEKFLQLKYPILKKLR